MDHMKICTVGLGSPRQELSVRGLGFVVARLVFWENIFSCASAAGPIQLYVNILVKHLQQRQWGYVFQTSPIVTILNERDDRD